MLRVALRTLRFRKGGFVATFLAMTFGAMIVMASGGLMETGLRKDIPTQRFAAAPIVVTGDQNVELPKANPGDPEEDVVSGVLTERVRVDDDLVATLDSLPGVESAIGDITFTAALPGDVLVDAHGWSSARLTPYELRDGAAPRRGEVVVGAALAGGSRVGDRLEIVTDGTTETFTVAGVAEPAGAGPAPGVFLSDADAERLAGHPGAVDAIGVLAELGADLGRVRAEVDAAVAGSGALVLTGDERGVAEFPEAAKAGQDLILMSAPFGGIVIMISLFVVATTLGLSIQQRQRELALLRTVGTTPGQLRRMVIGEALVTSLFATTVGSVLGVPLGRWLFDRLVGAGIAPEAMEFRLGWLPMIVAVGSSLLITLGAAWVAGRRAARTRPTEALVAAGVQRRWLSPIRLILALVTLAGGAALFIVTISVMSGPTAASTAGPSVLLWAIGLALIGPALTRMMLAIVRWPVRAVTGTPGYLATQNARTRTVRMAGVVVPFMLATGVATGNLYLQTTSVAVANEAYVADLRADLVLDSSTGGLMPELVDEVRAMPGVAAASEFASTTAYVTAPHDSDQDEEGRAVQGVSADGAGETTAVDLVEGALNDLRGDTVILPVEHAESLGRGVGDELTMLMADGAELDVEVVGLSSGRKGFATILMPADLVAAHTSSGLPAQIMVRASGDVAIADLSEALAGLAAGVSVSDRAALTADHAEQQAVGAWINYLMAGMIIAYTAISMVNSVVMSTAARRREFGLQRLTGSTRGQVLRMMGVEAGMVSVIGVVLGTAVAALTLVPFTVAAGGSLLPSGPAWIYLTVVGVATVLAVGSTLLTTWFSTRSRPAEAAAAPA